MSDEKVAFWDTMPMIPAGNVVDRVTVRDGWEIWVSNDGESWLRAGREAFVGGHRYFRVVASLRPGAV